MIALYAYDGELRRAPAMASNPLMAEIRLTWWREVLDQIHGGAPARHHPVAQALAIAVRRGQLPREPLEGALDARLYALGGERTEGEVEAAEHLTEAACLALDPRANRQAARVLGRAWASGTLDGEARRAGREISVEAFPAVAHAALAGRGGSEFGRRVRLMWAVATGRV